MKIGNWKLKILNNKGEIATILTVVTLGLMLVGTVVGTKLAGQGPREQSEARGFGELQTYGTLDNCKWNTAGELCKDSGDKGRCICEKLGTGICTPVGASCEKNPWDSSWGCWSVAQCKDPGAPPPPPADGGQQGGQQQGGQQAASCTLSDQKNDPGNCCSTCIASKRPDLRPFFNSNGWSACNDTQIVNNWCNGILANIPTESPTYSAKGDCKKIREGDCKDACSKDQSTCQSTGGTTGGTAGTPAPTVPPPPASSGGSTDGGTETPGEPKTGGYLIVEGRNLILNRKVNPPNSSIDIESENEGELPTKLVSGSNYISVASPTTRGTSPITYQYPLSGKIVKKLDFASPNLLTTIAFFGISTWEGVTQSQVFTPSSDSSSEIKLENLKVCFPRFTESEQTKADTNTLPASTIIGKCSGRINILDQEATLPEPSPPPDYTEEYVPTLKVSVKMNDRTIGNKYSLSLYLPPQLQISENGRLNSINLDDQPYPSDYHILPGTNVWGMFKSDKKIKRYSDTQRDIKLLVNGTIYDEVNDQVTTVYCNYSNNYIIEKDQPITSDRSNALGSLIFSVTFNAADHTPKKCDVQPSSSGDDGILIGQGLFGSSNESFKKAMERWVAGEIGVLEMSGFVNQLTRYPGLQISFCDPRKGECNL